MTRAFAFILAVTAVLIIGLLVGHIATITVQESAAELAMEWVR